MKSDREKQAGGKIFLADQRSVTENTRYRRYSTFTFGEYVNEHKAPFGDLYLVNEEIVAGSQQIEVFIAEASYVIILPITGQVNVIEQNGKTTIVDVGEVLVQPITAQSNLLLANPYEKEVITFLQVAIKANGSSQLQPSWVTTFDCFYRESALAGIRYR